MKEGEGHQEIGSCGVGGEDPEVGMQILKQQNLPKSKATDDLATEAARLRKKVLNSLCFL